MEYQSDFISRLSGIWNLTRALFFLCLMSVALASCAVYTPQRLPEGVSQKLVEPEEIEIEFVSIDSKQVVAANRTAFSRLVVDGTNLHGAAVLNSESRAINARWPSRSEPLPYTLGPGDVVRISRLDANGVASTLNQKLSETGTIRFLDVGRRTIVENLPPTEEAQPYRIGPEDILVYSSVIEEPTLTGISRATIQTQPLRVSRSGVVNILGVGEVSVANLQLEEAQAAVEQALLRRSIPAEFQLEIQQFNSANFVVGGDFVPGEIIPYTSTPVSINNLVLLNLSRIEAANGLSAVEFARQRNLSIKLDREGAEYRISAVRLLTDNVTFYAQPGDRILLESAPLNPSSDPIILAGLTIEEARQTIQSSLTGSNQNARVSLDVIEFNSKKFNIVGDVSNPGVFAISDVPFLLAEALSTAGLNRNVSVDQSGNVVARTQLVTLKRGGQNFRFSVLDLLENPHKIYLRPNDAISITTLNYRSEQVIIAGAVPAQRTFPISAESRPTLSDALFESGALDNGNRDPSQIYVLRMTSDTAAKAYHFNFANPVRISLASNFEMRPNDVVFVSEQPVSEFNRVVLNILSGFGTIATVRNNVRDF